MTVTIADVNERARGDQRAAARGGLQHRGEQYPDHGRDVLRHAIRTRSEHAVTWSLASGGDSRFFEIDAATARSASRKANSTKTRYPTDESTGLGSDEAYNVTVTVPPKPTTGTRRRVEPRGSLAVTVRRYLDVNEPPTITGPETVDPQRTGEHGRGTIATYRATDPDERATITWSVEDPGTGDFTITNAGALSFASAPNYEVKSSYTVTVRASDGTNDR